MSLFNCFRGWLNTASDPGARRPASRTRLAVQPLEDRTVPAGGITEFTLPNSSSSPEEIVAGPDGNLWFTEFSGNRIGRITPAGVVTEFPIPGTHQPQGITAGPDGNLWFTEQNSPGIARITPTGVITDFSANLPSSYGWYGITAGPDENLWFTDYNGVGRMTPQGAVTYFTSGITPGRDLLGITTGPDGNLWFAERNGGGWVGRITPQGQATEFPAGYDNYDIAVGADGNLWFTDILGDIDRITPTGQVTQVARVSDSFEITAGPDGNLWFTELSANRIGRLKVGQPTTVGISGSLGATAPYGQAETLTAALGWTNASGRPDPAGAVTFYDGATSLGSAMVSGRVAVLNVPALTVGTHHLTAQYAGDANYDGSSAPATDLQVTAATTAVALNTVSSSTAGDQVTLSATVTNNDSPATPTGYATFFDNGVPIGVATVSGGEAAVGFTPTVAGIHHLTAAFTPAAGFQPSQTPGPTDLTVTAAATTLTLDAPASWTAGDQVTLSATVSNNDSSAVPAGYVTFYDFDEPFAVATLSGGVAGAVLTSDFANFAATHWLTATFTPAAGFSGSQTPGPIQPVARPAAPAKLDFEYSPDFALSGEHVSATALVEDRYGNWVQDSTAPVTVFLTGPGKWGMAGTRTAAVMNGFASFDLVVTGRGPGFTLTATSPDLLAAASEPFTVSAAVKFKLKLTAPAVAGQPFTITVTALDSRGRVDPYYQGTVWLTDPTGNGLTGETFLPSDNGQKTFTLTVPTAGKLSLSADDGDGVRGVLTIKVKS